jgi:hypothetical protein
VRALPLLRQLNESILRMSGPVLRALAVTREASPEKWLSFES